MNIHNKGKQLEATYGWWNSEKIDKWDKKYDDYDIYTMRYLNSRQKKVLKFVDEIKLKSGAKVLELGYGAGQTALKLGQRGFEVHGLDISNKLCELAKQRCQKECPEGNFFLRSGNIESKLDYESETFDMILIVGVLQYLYDPGACLNEVYRLLKPGGYLINAQRNYYCLSKFSSCKRLLATCIQFFLKEKYLTFPSIKSMLVDSKLGYFFKRFENSKLFNTKFMLQGKPDWKFLVKKNIFSYRILKSLLLKKGFSFIKADGAYYYLSEKPERYEFNLRTDDYLQKLIDQGIAPFLTHRGRSTIILSQKK